MLTRWGRAVVARRRFVALAALLLAVVGVAWGSGVFDRLVTGGFEDPGSESAQANARIAQTLGGDDTLETPLLPGFGVPLARIWPPTL